MNFLLPRMKTKETSEDVNIMDSTCQCSLTTTLEHHLSSNSAIPAHAPLFAFETGPNLWSPMSHSWFMQWCNEIWVKDSLTSVKGHGFCISGTTHLLLLGIDPWVVMVQGHWSSNSFLSYWHKCEEILSLFIGFSFQSHESVLLTMSSFKSKLTAWPCSLPFYMYMLLGGVKGFDCTSTLWSVVWQSPPLWPHAWSCRVHVGTWMPSYWSPLIMWPLLVALFLISTALPPLQCIKLSDPGSWVLF